MTIRILIDAAVFLTVLFFPPIFPIAISLILLYYYESFYEIIFVGIIIDSLYGRPIGNLYNFSYPMTFVSTALFVSSIFIKKMLKFYSDR